MATNREIQAAKTRDKLYETALKLINQKGFENVSVEDITQTAGVAKGTFYHHFDSKENLLYYTYVYLDSYYDRALEQAKKKDSFLSAYTEFVIESYKRFEGLGRNLVRALCMNLFTEENRKAMLSKDRALYSSIEYLMSVGKEEGVIDKDLNFKEFSDVYITMLIGIETYWSLSEGSESLSDYAQNCLGRLLNGFLKR